MTKQCENQLTCSCFSYHILEDDSQHSVGLSAPQQPTQPAPTVCTWFLPFIRYFTLEDYIQIWSQDASVADTE